MGTIRTRNSSGTSIRPALEDGISAFKGICRQRMGVRLPEHLDVPAREGCQGARPSAGSDRIGLSCRSVPTRSLRYQSSSLLQALIAPALPRTALEAGRLVRQYLRRSDIEPGLALASPLHAAGITVRSAGLRAAELPRQVRNVFRRLGLVRSSGGPVDVVDDIIQDRYQVSGLGGEWTRLLGAEYAHAIGILVQAETVFWSGRSQWLSHQSSFNQVAFLALQRHFRAIGTPGVVPTLHPGGELIDYGVTLDKNNAFSRAHPAIANVFREINARRNKLPGSHPYEQKSLAQTKYLTASERNRFVAQLRTAYAEVLKLCP